MGGGAVRGHAMVVALHLYKVLKSSRKFTEMMTRNFDTTIKGVDCLIPFNDQLKVQSTKFNNNVVTARKYLWIFYTF